MEISDTLVGGALRKGISGGQSECARQGLPSIHLRLTLDRISRETIIDRMYSCHSSISLDLGRESRLQRWDFTVL
jgi:hypothetical protein